MASKTTNYGLNKHSPQDFYNVEARNENWDKIDAELKNNVDAANARVKTAELAAEVKKVVKDGSLTAADLGAEKAGAAAALEKKVDALGAGDVGADPTGAAASAVSAHNKSASAHSALFAKKQDVLKGQKGKYLGFNEDNVAGEVDAPMSGGSHITMTFAADFKGCEWTLTGGDETYTGTVDESLTAVVSVLGINTIYTLSCGLDGETYSAEVQTGYYYTSLTLELEKFLATITVTVDSGSVVTATLGYTVLTKTSTGTVVFKVCKPGTWTIKATLGEQATEDAEITISTNGESKALTLSYANVFGVCWDTPNSSTALTRLTPSTDPYGLVTRSVTTEPVPAEGSGSGSSPFDAYAPWSGMKECNLNASGKVTAWKGDSGFARSNNYTMVFIPVFYVAQKRSGTKQYFYVSDKPKTGMTKHPGSGKYVGRYHMNDGGDGYSKTGVPPYVDMTRASVRNTANSKGSKFHLYDFATYCAIIFLYIVEFADWNSQSKIGQGVVSEDYTQSSGGTDVMNYHTGNVQGYRNGITYVQYRWIENLWGNVCQWVDGFNVNSTTAYYCTDPSKYADDTATGYTNIGTLPADGWIKDLTVTDTGLLIPKTTGGSETTYIPDCMWSYSGGWRMLYVGGYWNKGMSAGLLYFEATTTSSNSGTNVSTRLMCEP